jgi:hypothetical protein
MKRATRHCQRRSVSAEDVRTPAMAGGEAELPPGLPIPRWMRSGRRAAHLGSITRVLSSGESQRDAKLAFHF